MTITIGVIDTLQAAVEAAKKTNPADLRKLHEQIGAMVKAEEAKHGVEASKQRKREAALRDPQAPVVVQAMKTLGRLGLSPTEASDLSRLNAALDSHRWSTEERFRCKALLHTVGII
jgi:hypothetical protein